MKQVHGQYAETNNDNDPDQRRGRRRLLGYACYLAGCLSLLFTVGFALAALSGAVGVVAGIAVFTALLLLTILLLVTAEGFLLPDAREVCETDPRAPVVYLRPFGEDVALTYDVISTGEGGAMPLTAKAEDFLLSLNAVGPLVSIAEPNLASRIGVHPHGVAREFIGEGDWQARVTEMLDRAVMVVLAIGDSPGIEWEIAQVRARIAPQALLLYLPPRPIGALTRKGRAEKERAIYEKFAPLVERHFDIEMPPFREAMYIIGFDSHRQPVMAVDAPRRGWALTEHSRVTKAIRTQLEAVLDKVRPGTDLRHYRLPGRAGLWRRLAATLTLLLGVIAIAIAIGRRADAGGALSEVLGVIVTQLLPGVMLVAGWALLARYFVGPEESGFMLSANAC